MGAASHSCSLLLRQVKWTTAYVKFFELHLHCIHYHVIFDYVFYRTDPGYSLNSLFVVRWGSIAYSLVI